MSNFTAHIDAIINARNLPSNYLDFPDPATLPTHCFVVNRTSANGRQVNDVVPVIQDPPAPNIMDAAHECGLYNPYACVRRSVVEAIRKTYGVMWMKRAASEGGGPTDRIKDRATIAAIRRSVATGSLKEYTRVGLAKEELATFEVLIGNWGDDWVEGTAEVGMEMESEIERDGTVAGVESEGKEPAIGAAAVEKEGKEPAEKQKKKKQPKPAPAGTAWYLQRGKELDSKRSY
ncbi:MAG: hypothetical protein ASARMPRED_001278 [Alectoria sarmentosa]|nr:MAG: hypothetical protein ASARMPRED_001278 [Alectoria sarmentosa]